MTTRKTKNADAPIVMDNLGNVLISIFEPLHKLHLTNPNRINDRQTDTGHDKGVDTGMRILIDMMANTVYRQLYGTLMGSNGEIPNANERLKRADELWENHKERYAGDLEAMTADPRTYELTHYYEMCSARCDAMQELLNGFKECFKTFTGEDWKPRPMGGTNGNGRKVELTEEAKAAALAALAKLEEKRKTLTSN